MRPYAVFILTWLTAGAGAVVGSILGNAAGRAGLMVGAVIGGTFGVLASVAAAVRFGWLPAEARNSATLGGIVGFLVAAPIAVANLDTPITPVVACGLVGVGVLIGAGAARRS